MLMEEIQRRGQLECQVHAFADGQLAAAAEHVRQGLGRVGFCNDFLTLVLVVTELHNVIEIASHLVASHMQYVDEAGMRARDGGESLNASEFPIKRGRVGECTPVNEFHCVK